MYMSPWELAIPRLLKRRAEESPDAVAIVSPGRIPLTYGRLLNQVDHVVRALKAMDIGRHDCVAVVLADGPETAVALLGVASGARCAPLNPAYRESEFELYLADLKPKALIVESGVDSPAIGVCRRHGIAVVTLSPLLHAETGIFDLDGVAAPSSGRSEIADQEDVALVLYTSGTTSKPKRVPLTHKNILTSAENVTTVLGLNPIDRCLNVMPLYHIHGLVGAFLSSLVAGGSIALPPGFDGTAFFDWMKELQPTWYTAVPTIHQAVLRAVKKRMEISRHGSLRFIRSSSAPLPAKVMAELEEVFQVPVIEAYGMTEASHQIASNPLPPRERKAGSVGVPAGTEIAVIDRQGNFLPAGEMGEIALRGPNITRGYDDNALANEEAFTNGWFRTGDQGYLDTDGYLFLTGRLKEMINRGGEKVSPREIDEALLDHPDVSQAVTFAVPHPSLGEDIAAAVVVGDRVRTTEAEIRRYLIGRLAAFKVPSRLLIVDDIANGSTGKIQRIGLAKKFAARLGEECSAPKNDIESTLADIYAEVLGAERVSPNDNFFALGGDSLSANQLLSRIRKHYQVNLPIATIFWKATVADLADEILRAAEMPH